MAETHQKARTRKVQEVSQLVEAQSLQLADQSKAMDTQSAQVAEQAAKLEALQGESEGARPRSPAPDVRLTGSYSFSASRQSVPKLHGEAPQYPMWRKKILSHISMFGCREAVAPRAQPILVGDDGVMPSELRREHSPRDIKDATRTSAISVEGFVFSSLANKIFRAGSPSGGWKVVEDWFEPRGAAQQDVWLAYSENLRLQKGEHPFVWIGRVDDVFPQDRGYDPPSDCPSPDQ